MTFRIKKGKHWSGLHFGLTFKRKVQFDAIFDESCIYSIDGTDSFDINKLYGFSTSLSHHNQSARIGWRCIDGVNIQLFAYSYTFGKSIINKKSDEQIILGSVVPGERFYCTIEDLGNEYVYSFRTRMHVTPVIIREEKKKDWLPFRYFLYPYFGGNMPAPHSMEIHIKRT